MYFVKNGEVMFANYSVAHLQVVCCIRIHKHTGFLQASAPSVSLCVGQGNTSAERSRNYRNVFLHHNIAQVTHL